jgi:hypothetical protein
LGVNVIFGSKFIIEDVVLDVIISGDGEATTADGDSDATERVTIPFRERIVSGTNLELNVDGEAIEDSNASDEVNDSSSDFLGVVAATTVCRGGGILNTDPR